MSLSLFTPSLHARQWSDKGNKTCPLWPIFHSVLRLCHVPVELSSSLAIISFHSFIFFLFTLNRKLLLQGHQTSVFLAVSRWRLMAPDVEAVSLSGCRVVLIRNVESTAAGINHKQINQSQRLITSPKIYRVLRHVSVHFTKLSTS